MMKKFIFIFILFPILLFTQSHTIIPDSVKINRLLSKPSSEVHFQSPLILKNSILFFYRGKAKAVILAGDFNDWQDNLYMEESRSNLWIFSWTNRLSIGKYKYRLKIDGFWISDPNNPDFILDTGREQISILNIKNEFIPNKKYPLWISNNLYLFRHYNTNVKAVSIVGDFNNWNPYSHQMTYKGAGIFEIILPLETKQYYLYSFVQDGIWTFDINNKKQFRNGQNRPVSGFYADMSNSKP